MPQGGYAMLTETDRLYARRQIEAAQAHLAAALDHMGRGDDEDAANAARMAVDAAHDAAALLRD